jgi:hypothetical protein
VKKRACLAVVLSVLLAQLPGCVNIGNIDELYSLPQPQDEFLQLRELIDEEIAAGSEYLAPTVGSRRQSIQLTDIDGDGREEALAFLRNEELVPKICVYKNIDGVYELASTISGEGTAIGRVEYADLDGDGLSEIMVSWKTGTELMLVSAYSLKDWNTAVMLSENCADFLVGDIDGDGRSDITALNFDDEGGGVEVFFADKAGDITHTGANVSKSMKDADRFRISAIAGNVPAIFVEGHCKNEESGTWYMTDIFVFSEDKLRNITMDRETSDSVAKRSYEVFSCDIDGDVALEVPFAEQVYIQPKVTAQYYVFDWYSYDTSGAPTLRLSTYHNYNDGWYLVLPTEWRNGFTVRRETDSSGERSVVLSTYNPSTEKVADIVTIYMLTDENRSDRAQLGGRFILLSSEGTIYAAEFNDMQTEFVTEERKQDMISRFHLIYSEWNTGAV